MSTAPSSQDVPAEMRSTWPQRALTLAGSAAILSSLLTTARLVAASGSPGADMLAAAVAAFTGYSLADLATGVYHWLIDNYGCADTPVLGAQIVAFQDNHLHPSAITRLEPCNNLHVVTAAVAVALPAADAALSAARAPAAAHACACAFAACVVMSVQFHAWAHERAPSRLPPGVAALQDAGVLVSRPQHAGHHRPAPAVQHQLLHGQRHVEPGARRMEGVRGRGEGDLPCYRCQAAVVAWGKMTMPC